jgi:hypothetical protein
LTNLEAKEHAMTLITDYHRLTQQGRKGSLMIYRKIIRSHNNSAANRLFKMLPTAGGTAVAAAHEEGYF